jgi:hypothetical protein
MLITPEGANDGFVVSEISLDQLRWILCQNKNVTQVSKQKFFVWSDNIKIKFTFGGILFTVHPDDWDGSFWVTTAEITKCNEPVIDLSNYMADSIKALDRIPFQKTNLGTPLFLGLLMLFPLMGAHFISGGIKIAVFGGFCFICILWILQWLLYVCWRKKAIHTEAYKGTKGQVI